MIEQPFDVLVIGGGSAGVVAAIQAGRAGARTLLVEKTGMLGGTTTMAAGAAAALAVRDGLEVAEVSVPELRDLLRIHGAIIPG